MTYIENTNFLSIDSKKFLNETVMGDNFPYFFQTGSTIDDNYEMLSHTILRRPEERNINEKFNSSFSDNFIKIFSEFIEKNNLKQKYPNIELLRMSVNLTFNNGTKHCPIHIDHNYPHFQLIVYLNDADNKSKTVILNEKNKVIKKIIPKKFKGILFDNKKHYHFYPTKGIRSIIVYTFRSVN